MSKLRSLRYIGALLLTAISTTNIKAVPAKPGVQLVKNADGSTLTIELHGDESMHFRTTTDGYVVTTNKKGNYVYLTKNISGDFTPSNIVATSNLLSSNKHVIYQDILVTKEDIATKNNRSYINRAQQMSVSSPMSAKGKKKGLVLLVEFSDVKFQIPSPKSEFSNMLNTTGYTNSYGQVGSAKDYFKDVSMGQFDPEFEILGPITLPNTLSSYGGNGSEGYDRDPARMVYDALKLVDLSSVEMSSLDDDKDGFADNLFVFYAGYSEAEGGPQESIWPHAANLKLLLSLTDNMLPQKDGVKFNDYACGSELADKDGLRMSGIGAFCHEFSHILGLPDTYDTDYTTNGQAFGLDSWSIMANGPYNGNGNIPPSFNAWERWKSGWLSLTELEKADDYTLSPLQESNQAYILRNSNNSNEYFIIENRQQTMWDRALSGHGMMIYHLDFTSNTPWLNNQVNANSSRQCFEIEAADNIQSKSTLSGDPYPGSSNKREFTDNTSPSSRLWSGELMQKPITEIIESDGEISFKLSGGFVMSSPTNILASNILENGFDLSWNESERASSYLLDIYTETVIDNGIIDKIWDFADGVMNSELNPSGSFSVNNEVFGDAAPSMKTTNLSRDITTPNYGFNLESFGFWYNVLDNNDLWSIKLDVFVDGSWKSFETINQLNTSTTGRYYTEQLPENTQRVRVSWSRGNTSNTLSIDDIFMRYHDLTVSRTYLGDYNNKDIGNLTTHQVVGAKGSTKYTCVVRSTNGYSISANSLPLEVTTSESTDIEENIKDQLKVYKSGYLTVTIENSTSQSLLANFYSTTGLLVHRENILNDKKEIVLTQGGIYIIKIEDMSFKLAL
ncbi:MAG: M6 family metalloprotease domain-containing protein [Bacteroidales bacterium]